MNKKKILIFSIVGAVVIASLIILLFTVFMPLSKKDNKLESEKMYNSALYLLENGYYSEAIEQFEKLDYKDSSEQILVAKACIEFAMGNFDEGIELFCKANGTINVTYNADGGKNFFNDEIITSRKVIDNTASKTYYSFTGWKIESFFVETKEKFHVCNLTLIAKYEPIYYTITYSLDGGTNSIFNKRTYDVTKGAVSLQEPTKKGYLFEGWFDGEKTIKEYVVENLTDDLTLTAKWQVKEYTVNVDLSGGEYDGDNSFTVTYDSSIELNNPSKFGCIFKGWYFNNEKMGSTWKFDSDQAITLTAKWESSCLSYLKYEDFETGIIITGMKSGFTDQTLIIPDSINGKTVVAIEEEAFANLSNVTYVEVPKSVTIIGEGAFAGMNKLEKMVIPFVGVSATYNSIYNETPYYQFGAIFGDSGANTNQYCYYEYYISTEQKITSMSSSTSSGNRQSYAWYVPTTLKEVEITNATSIWYGAFSNCTNIEKITLPDTCENIYAFAFYGCSALNRMSETEGIANIPTSVAQIPAYGFYGCSEIQNITFGQITSIGDYAFYDCIGLQSLELSEKLTNIGEYAFYNCSSIKHVNSENDGYLVIPSKCKTIDDYAFGNLRKITYVEVPKSVTIIGEGAFAGMNKLEKMVIPFVGVSATYNSIYNETPYYQFGAIFGDSGANTNQYCYYEYYISTEQKITSMSSSTSSSNRQSYAWYVPTTLKEVEITNATSIWYGAFSNCTNIEKITLPNTCQNIYAFAFENCSAELFYE